MLHSLVVGFNASLGSGFGRGGCETYPPSRHLREACPITHAEKSPRMVFGETEKWNEVGRARAAGPVRRGGKRQRVLDAVAEARRARVHLVKDVMVHPFSVRAFQLLIDKLTAGIPAADSRPPPQRQTVKKDRVVDQCSFIHANRHGGEDLEAKGRRSDSHQIGGIRKECKNLPTRDGNDHLSLEQMFQHCSGNYVWDDFLFVPELPLSGLSLASISRRRCSRKGGSERLSPSVSSGSSAVKPGSSVAISKRMPFGSRK